MKKAIIILLPITALFIGLVGGWFASAHSYNRWIESYMKTESYNDLSYRCRVLVQLRAGKTNEAIGLLETMMDGDIVSFGSFVRSARSDDHRAADMKLLTTVRDYRVAHPSESDYPEVKAGVTEVFTLISTNQSRW